MLIKGLKDTKVKNRTNRKKSSGMNPWQVLVPNSVSRLGTDLKLQSLHPFSLRKRGQGPRRI
jgi:hypothetical protein